MVGTALLGQPEGRVHPRARDLQQPDIELGAGGDTDAATVGSVIERLYPVLREIEPAAAVFLGDTNTVMGCLAAAQLNIPIVHIEGCMRAYDWRMPEEKYRTTIDHLADLIYTYFDEYKEQGVAEGLNPRNIVVVQNLIVDVLDAYYFDRRDYFDKLATPDFFEQRGLQRGQYYLMTCHRRENVEDPNGAGQHCRFPGPCPTARLLYGQLPDPEEPCREPPRVTWQRDDGGPYRVRGDAGAHRKLPGRDH